MPFIRSVPGEESPDDGANAMYSPVRGVLAHLKVIPGIPDDFRVVVTLARTDRSPAEAELTPVEAAGLMSEIARAIDLGNTGVIGEAGSRA